MIDNTEFNEKSVPSEGEPAQPVTSSEASTEPVNDKKENPNKILKISLSLIALAALILSVWGVGRLVLARNHDSAAIEPETISTPLPSPQLTYVTPVFEKLTALGGILRNPEIQTTSSAIERRTGILKYIVEPNDSIFSIADKFGLKPETVLWANRYTLGDTPDGLSIGFELVILPEDGVYHMWSEGEGLNGVSSFYGVDPDVIINYPLNNLDPNTIGDYSLPNIKPGTMLVVPGGTRPTVSWVVARDNPAEGSKYLGPNYCEGTIFGAVGTGTFSFPTVAHYLSGYDWNPPVHNGLDFDGVSGSIIYAADTGVVVYSGWSDRGYGNLLVVDHDDGWQTMYAHLLDFSYVPCGSNVYKGEQIALMGSTGRSTGPHLHFELRFQGTAVNPWDYLQ